MAQFSLSHKEKTEEERFKQMIKELYNDIGPIEYIFVNTGIGTVVKLSFTKYNIVKDITDYDSF